MMSWKAGLAGSQMISRQNQKGSALIYILIAIALLAALTATFMDSSSSQTSSQNAANIVTELGSQLNFIRTAIEECVLTYPGGDSTMPGTNPIGGHSPIRPYPLMPNNTYLATPTPATSYVKDLGCPGTPGNSNNHAKLFGGSSGKFLPPKPALFSDWSYYNSIDGISLWIDTNKTDAFLDTALQKLDAQFNKCESQYINAVADTFTTSDSAPGWRCTAGRKCFIVRIRTTGTTIYPGEVGCP